MTKIVPGSMILFVSILVGVALIVMSTYGWRFPEKPETAFNEEAAALARTLRSHVYTLSHEIGNRNYVAYENLSRTADYIREKFQSYGFQPQLQEFTASGMKFSNIIAKKEGADKPDRLVLVGAHYDTCFNPGADDNASGVAGLLELARLLAPEQTSKSIGFAAFANEEPPFFKTDQMGSRIYAREARAKNENIEAVLILESIGYYTDKQNSQRYPPLLGPFYPNRGNFIAVVGNPPSRKLVRDVASLFRSQSRLPVESIAIFEFVPGVDYSDNWSFWKEHYPAVMITDTAFMRNPHYHASSDTHEKLNYENMAEVVAGIRRVVLELAR